MLRIEREMKRGWAPSVDAISYCETRRSPEQIPGVEAAPSGDEEISHEMVYRSLFIQARGVLKKEVVGHLREGA